jgi:ABC-type phosphate/phosphonate transport system substrate-binding protein
MCLSTDNGFSTFYSFLAPPFKCGRCREKVNHRFMETGTSRLEMNWATIAGCILLVCSLALGQAPAGREESLHIAFSSSLFMDVNRTDALAAIKAWAIAGQKERGRTVTTEVQILSGEDAIQETLKNRKADMLALTALEFLKIKNLQDYDPLFVPCIKSKVSQEYIILCHISSGISSLEDLKGKSLLMLTAPHSGFNRIWLENLLAPKGVHNIDDFFRKITMAEKVSKAILPVFFRQSDACLVAKSSFETMGELNPQLRKELKTLATSPPFLSAVVCLRTDYEPKLKSALIESLETLHQYPHGQQIMTILKIDKLIPFEWMMLDNTKKEVAKWNQRIRQGQAVSAPHTP